MWLLDCHESARRQELASHLVDAQIGGDGVVRGLVSPESMANDSMPTTCRDSAILISPVGALAVNLEYYEDCGIHLFLMPKVLLDFHIAVRWNREADDVLGGSGLS